MPLSARDSIVPEKDSGRIFYVDRPSRLVYFRASFAGYIASGGFEKQLFSDSIYIDNNPTTVYFNKLPDMCFISQPAAVAAAFDL